MESWVLRGGYVYKDAAGHFLILIIVRRDYEKAYLFG